MSNDRRQRNCVSSPLDQMLCAAEFLGIQRQLVSRYIREGRLKGVMVCGQWFIPPRDLEGFSRIQRRVGGPFYRDRVS